MSRSALVYVQHLLGIGHLARANLIALAMQHAGLRVRLVVGGPPVAGFPDPALETVALPPLRAGQGGFSDLVDLDGRAADKGLLARRRDRLLAAFAELRPDMVVVEAYPFGRRQMRFEIEPLLAAARAADWAPLIACSVRDILQEGRKPGRDRETVEALKRFFDLVLVHGDPKLVPLEATFPLADEIAPLVRYTGLVTGPVGALQGPAFDVVVSAGGGAAGAALMRAARASLDRCRLQTLRWCFVTGPNCPSGVSEEIAAGLPAHAAVAPYRRDFRALLANARLSISQAGYNTASDVLQAGCRSVMVPFTAGGETEQTRRAAALAARGLVHVVSEAELSGRALAGAVDRAMEAPAPQARGVQLDGARRAAELVVAAVEGKGCPTNPSVMPGH